MVKRTVVVTNVLLTLLLVASVASAAIDIEAGSDAWTRPVEETTRNGDLLSIRSTATNDVRYGILSLDLSPLFGQTLVSAEFQVAKAYNDLDFKLEAFHFVADGTAPDDITWSAYAAEYQSEIALFETLGQIDLPAGSGTDVYFTTAGATAADLAVLQSYIDNGVTLGIVYAAVEDGGSYDGNLGDGEYGGSLPVLLSVNVPEPGTLTLLALGGLAFIRRRRS